MPASTRTNACRVRQWSEFTTISCYLRRSAIKVSNLRASLHHSTLAWVLVLLFYFPKYNGFVVKIDITEFFAASSSIPVVELDLIRSWKREAIRTSSKHCASLWTHALLVEWAKLRLGGMVMEGRKWCLLLMLNPDDWSSPRGITEWLLQILTKQVLDRKFFDRDPPMLKSVRFKIKNLRKVLVWYFFFLPLEVLSYSYL